MRDWPPSDFQRPSGRCSRAMCNVSDCYLPLGHANYSIFPFQLLHRCIDVVERKPTMTNNNILQGGTLVIKCKDLRIFSIEIKTPREFLNVARSIELLSKLDDDITKYYPFFFRPMYNILEDGHTMYRPEVEFSKLLAGDEWRLTSLNSDFTVCPSYATPLVVPKHLSDEEIISSAVFRDGGRFPIISYRHDSNGAIMLRSSQPTTTPNMRRCRADEAILNAVLMGKSKKGFIVDTWGKGRSSTETDQHYSQWRKVVRPVTNMTNASNILECFGKFIEACNDVSVSVDKFIGRVESSHWLSLVLGAMNVACEVAQCLHQDGSPVLVHGGKGLDTTLIVTSLVQIILNPDCRTVKGLQALIEREWLQAGFPFHTRHRQSCYTASSVRFKSSGSSFVLFLDCVFQLHSQFPCSFEFGTDYLIVLFEHSYVSQYGTFLCDSERERAAYKVQQRTTSLWSYLNRPEIIKGFLNPMYEPNKLVIWPSVAPISIVVWKALYLRFVLDQTQNQVDLARISLLISNEKELRSKAVRCRKQLQDLIKEYQSTK